MLTEISTLQLLLSFAFILVLLLNIQDKRTVKSNFNHSSFAKNDNSANHNWLLT